MTFSRAGVTALIFATGWRPVRRTNANTTTPASTRNIKIRFRSLRSIAPNLLRRNQPSSTRGHTRSRGILLYMPGFAGARPEYAEVTDSSNSSGSSPSDFPFRWMRSAWRGMPPGAARPNSLDVATATMSQAGWSISLLKYPRGSGRSRLGRRIGRFREHSARVLND